MPAFPFLFACWSRMGNVVVSKVVRGLVCPRYDTHFQLWLQHRTGHPAGQFLPTLPKHPPAPHNRISSHLLDILYFIWASVGVWVEREGEIIEHVHPLAVNSPDIDLLYSHVGSIGHYTDFTRGSWQGKFPF